MVECNRMSGDNTPRIIYSKILEALNFSMVVKLAQLHEIHTQDAMLKDLEVRTRKVKNAFMKQVENTQNKLLEDHSVRDDEFGKLLSCLRLSSLDGRDKEIILNHPLMTMEFCVPYETTSSILSRNTVS